MTALAEPTEEFVIGPTGGLAEPGSPPRVRWLCGAPAEGVGAGHSLARHGRDVVVGPPALAGYLSLVACPEGGEVVDEVPVLVDQGRKDPRRAAHEAGL